MNAIEHLEGYQWEHPDSYGGHSPDGDYLIYSRSRDSRVLDNSNYERILEDLENEAKKHRTDQDDSDKYVYDFRANHWACGWIDHIIVEKDSPESILIMAGGIICALSDYPVYDDSDYSEKEREYADSVWRDCYDIKGRVELIQKYGYGDVSIFAARHDSAPYAGDITSILTE